LVAGETSVDNRNAGLTPDLGGRWNRHDGLPDEIA
jgi:hypothetical protein